MSDFSPEVRNTALWSNDARRFVEGRAGEVYAEKVGAKPLDDLSDIEAVQMGLVMQEPIMREYARRKRINFKDADYMMRHPQHDFLASHFDYISEDGQILYEVKNLGIHQRKKYGDDESTFVDTGYFVQCLHESLVHRIPNVILIVCFGGQEICSYPLTFSEEQWDLHAKEMAQFWGRIKAQRFDPETMGDAAKIVYQQDNGSSLLATGELEQACERLGLLKTQIGSLEKEEAKLANLIKGYMMESGQLSTYDGRVLATWKNAKPSQKFSEELFKKAMPDIHKQFIVEQPGSRRFLLK